ncbi:MAG: NAD+ synthase [Candidatus Omnitrophota bacterium]
MKILRACLAQVNTTVGDISGNAEKIISCIREARKKNAGIVVFPELCLSGYPPEDLLLKPHFVAENKSALTRIARASTSILSIVGFPYAQKGKVFNAAALIYNTKLLGIYNKIYLPNYSVFDEKRYFAPGDYCHLISFGREVRIGFNICEDIWYPEGPQRTQAHLGGAQVIINISSSPYYAGKISLREKMLSQRARENGCFVLYCNSVGGQDELVFDGGSLAFDDKGGLVSRGKQFQEDLVTVDLDLSSLRQRQGVKKGMVFRIPKESLRYLGLPEIRAKVRYPLVNKIEKRLKPLDEVYAALVLGLKDYVRKNNFKKVVFGLSGGIDSALTAVLAVDALGPDNVIALAMPSQYSSGGTKDDARIIAHNLKIKIISIPISGLYKDYLVVFNKYFKGTRPGIAEQNIQARIRGNILMAFSNKFGWLVLTTGNKSEISTGYCTLYGDTAGGFAVLKDVPKCLVYKLAGLANKIKEIIPRSVFTRAPTAELKKNQKDQDSLPAYPLLDRVIELYVEKDKSFEDIMKMRFVDKKTLQKVILMVDRNEYKRRQSPPGIKITPKAFGKDRRMPITNAYSV